MVYRYDTIPYDTAPSPKQTKISIKFNHCTMPKHNKFLFKKRIMSTFLGLVLLLAAITSPALGNNFSDGTDIPQVPGTHQTTSRELSIVSELQGTKYRYCTRKYRYRWYR